MKNVLNLGCGTSPLPSTSSRKIINMDMLESSTENYIKHDLSIVPYPFNNEVFDEIWFFHTIEHIPEEKHGGLFIEFRRILRPKGRIAISYPEFTKCAQAYIDNKNGQRDFWKASIYGRGITEWDRHRALMDTPFIIDKLRQYGLDIISAKPEVNQDHNTMLICTKGEFQKSYEDLMGAEFRAAPA